VNNQQQFAAKVQNLIQQSRALTPATRKAVTELLDEARKRIIGELASADPSRFQAAQLTQLKQSIERAMDTFRRGATREVNLLQLQSARIGSRLATEPLGDLPLGQIATDRIRVAQGYTADLITSLSRKAAADVNGAIQRAFLGGRQMKDIVADIAAAVGEERVKAIATTEVLRVQSIATQASFEEIRERHPDLRKQWQHVNAAIVPRVSHVIADGQVREVQEAFTVDGEQLMYPRDPNGSAANTISCHCLMKPYFDPEALAPKPAHRRLLDRLGIGVDVEAA